MTCASNEAIREYQQTAITLRSKGRRPKGTSAAKNVLPQVVLKEESCDCTGVRLVVTLPSSTKDAERNVEPPAVLLHCCDESVSIRTGEQCQAWTFSHIE